MNEILCKVIAHIESVRCAIAIELLGKAERHGSVLIASGLTAYEYGLRLEITM